jgi:hypothetical protein
MKRLLVCVFMGLLGACAAEDRVKQGDVNEFCQSSNDDCRPGLVCSQGICQLPGPQALYGCEEICAKLASCNVAESSCVVDCRATTLEWSLPARDTFGVCVVEDITCEEAQNMDVPQVCYERITLRPERKLRCDTFVEVADVCDSSVDTEPLKTACYRLGRTGDDTQWQATEQCENAIGVGICSGLATCYNDVFELSPPISLGNGTLNNDNPTPVFDGDQE